MRPYANLTDDEILTEIAEYQAALKSTILGGVEEVAGEGRRIKYFGLDKGAANAALRELYAEAAHRGMEGSFYGSAIPVEIG